MLYSRLLLIPVLLAVALRSSAQDSSVPLFTPDPASVQWCGPAYRYPQAGWIVLHIEGAPHERGLQHGTLLHSEIIDHLQCMAQHYSPKAPMDAWRQIRTLVNATFVRRFDHEFLEEMQGIVDGVNDKEGRFDGRPVDLIDIVALNVWAELMTLDGALNATPNGMEGLRFPKSSGPTPAPPAQEHCSAFAATGPATADGHIVFGHITMYDLYPSSFFNVWIDIKPLTGYRLVMQSYPGGMQSGLDYYMNSAGMLCCETTINQTRYDVDGKSLSSQIRKALQYGGSIDEIVARLKEPGNGLYSNEWLIGDTKTDEIAMFEQGTHAFKLWRSGKNEWFQGTEGFYWSDNNVKDAAVKLETIASLQDRPVNVVFNPRDRDLKWVELYRKSKGHIDANFGREALTSAPLAAYTSVDAKCTTSAEAKELRSWAMFGPPRGRTWLPSPDERQHFPAIRPMVSNPWTLLHSSPPAPRDAKAPVAVDLGGPRKDKDGGHDPHTTLPGWRGTIFPKTDADVWLAAAFANYERIFSRERARADASSDHCLCDADKKKSSGDLYTERSTYLRAMKKSGDTPLSQLHSTPDDDSWYRIASGKGVLVLHELRALVGDKVFAEAMDSFGMSHAGGQVDSADFAAHFEKASGKDLKAFFDYWLNQTGLPRLKLSAVTMRSEDKKFFVEGTLSAEGGPLPAALEATLETADGDKTHALKIAPETGRFTIESDKKPLRLVVDKFGRSAIANGGTLSLSSFMSNLEHTLIIYGTLDDASANAQAAVELQTALIQRGPNYTVPVRSDRDVTDADLRANNVLLIGRPESNRVGREWAAAFPIRFGTGSFRAGGDLYAHADSALAVVTLNPLDPRKSAIMIAGLGAAGTYRIAANFGWGDGGNGEAAIFEHGGEVHRLVLPAAELQVELSEK